MPEGDTIFRAARALSRVLTGKLVTRFDTGYAQLARANDEEPFTGQVVESVEARGKWLLIHFSSGKILATHMLMSGSWHIYRHGEPWQERAQNARVVVETAEFVTVGFRVPVARVYTPESLMRESKIPRTDRDVLSPEFNATEAVRRIMARGSEEIANVLLRQDVLAGVGNVFKSEILFLLGIDPFRLVETLTRGQVEEIVATAQRLLAANVLEDSGGQIVTYSGHRRTTNNADPGASLWVYRRNGKECRRCGATIERQLQGPNARSTYWCPDCQPSSIQ